MRTAALQAMVAVLGMIFAVAACLSGCGSSLDSPPVEEHGSEDAAAQESSADALPEPDTDQPTLDASPEVSAPDGDASTDEACVPSGVEVCDGLDNDCDGEVDDSLSDEGVACDSGLPGPCAPGVTACSQAVLTCVPTSSPSIESCDGIDNDCDGAIDDGNPEGGAACDSGQPGSCSSGAITCLGASLVCMSVATPSPELCDGIDTDCDGVVDNGVESTDPAVGATCNTGSLGPCATGNSRCQSGVLVCDWITPPTWETCDGVDNDCDGVVDNGDPGGGAACDTALPGPCQQGSVHCQSGVLACSPNTPASTESCDGIDNDCDGQIDENVTDGSCDTGLWGNCAAGIRRCQSGQFVCVQLHQPAGSDTVCDGVDNDCDGLTDETTNVCSPATSACLFENWWQPGHRYAFCNLNKKDWYSARGDCPSGYDLVKIDTALENIWVRTRASAYATGPWWIGASDAQVEGQWLWCDGSTPTYVDWHAGEPNNEYGAEDCAMTNYFSTGGSWNDADCSLAVKYICESKQ